MCGGGHDESIRHYQQQQQQENVSMIDNNNNNNTQDKDVLTQYLNSFLMDANAASVAANKQYQRVFCCGASRSLYCPECCHLVIPKHDWPEWIHALDLPFDLHLILHDRRKSSSGLHAVTMLNAAAEAVKQQEQSTGETATSCSKRHDVRLIDAVAGDDIPAYTDNGTFLLFPSEDSVPLSQVVCSLKTLVVLDCKWTRCSKKDSLELARLRKVHLTLPLNIQSHFWRWHNAGPGRVSTMEAIYYAANEVLKASETNDRGFSSNTDSNLIHIMWLFGLKRAMIQRHAQMEGRLAMPFDDTGKEEQRALRRITEEQRLATKMQARQRNQRQKELLQKAKAENK